MDIYSIIKAKKGLIAGLLATVMFAVFARMLSTYTINDSEIDYYESQVKERLPFYLGYIGSVTYVYTTEKEMVFICDVNENNVTIDNLRKNMRGTRQNCMISLMSNTGSPNYLFSILTKYGKGIKVIYKGKKESLDVCFSIEEIKNVVNNKIEYDKLAYDYIEKYVSDKNAICPIKLSDTLSLVELKLDKSTFYYYHTVNEINGFSLDNVDSDISLIEFFKHTKDPNLRSVGRKVAVAGLDVKLIYTSTQTGKQKVFPFKNKELVEVLMDSTIKN